MFMNICIWLTSIILASLFTVIGCAMIGYDQNQRER